MKKLPISILLLLFIASSCERDLKVEDIPAGTKMVANAFINPDSSFRLEFSTSGLIDGSFYPQQLKDVEFRIAEDGIPLPPFRLDSSQHFVFMDQDYSGMLNLDNDLYYFTHDSLKPKAGSRYTLFAERPGFPEITAETVVPGVPIVEDIQLIREFTLTNAGTSMARIRFTINDSGAINPAYAVRMRFFNEVDSFYHYADFVSPDPVLIENKPSDLIETGGGSALGYSFTQTESAIFSSESFRGKKRQFELYVGCLLYTSPSPRDS